MTEADLQIKLAELMALPTETEWAEFKEAKNNIDLDDLGRYVSALSNEANLKGQTSGWMMLGVSNKPPRQVVGTSYRLQTPGLEKLKQEIAKQTNHQFTFREIHEIGSGAGRVLLFEIPPAPRGVPITWRHHGLDKVQKNKPLSDEGESPAEFPLALPPRGRDRRCGVEQGTRDCESSAESSQAHRA